MEIVTLIPGDTTAGDDIDLPDGAPSIEAVVAASIERLPHCLADHDAADIVAALNPHTGANVRDALDDHLDTDILGAVGVHSAALMGAAIANHTQAHVVAALAAHAVHGHEILVGSAGAPADAYGAVIAATAHICAAAVNLVIGAGATGLRNYTTPAHAAGGATVAHAAGADVNHVAGATPVGHTGVGGVDIAHGGSGTDVTHAAAAPTVVATTPVRVTASRFELGDNTLLGDTLTLFYLAVGERVLAS